MAGAPDERSVRFRRDIQGLRGVAVLLVIVYHAGLPLTGGFVGVDVFFVVSGLVITRMLVSELENTGRINLLQFYSRRAKRLLPALALVLVVVMLASVALGALGSLERTSRTGAAAALVVANMELYRFGDHGYFDQASHLNPFLHTWSLSLEEQFYLFFPSLLGISWSLRRRTGWLGRRALVRGLVLIVCAVSFALSALMTASDGRLLVAEPRIFSFYSAPTRAWEFGLGVLVALSSNTSFAGSPVRSASALGGWLLVAWAAFTYSAQTSFPGTAAVAPALGAALLLATGGQSGARPWPVRLLENSILVRIGDLSYSWYLWHWPCIVFGRALFPGRDWVPSAMALLSLAPAWASYAALEDPVRRWNPPSARPIAALTLACVVLPLFSAWALRVANRSLPTLGAVASYENARRLHLDVAQGCDSSAPLGARANSSCLWSVPNPRGRVVLIGDSNAGHFTEPVLVAARSLGLAVEVATFSACPFADVISQRNGKEQAPCRRFYDASLAQLAADPPDLVIAASASDVYIRHEEYALAGQGRTVWQRHPSEKALLWAKGLERTLRSIRRTGSQVLVVHPIPRLQEGWQAGSCAVLSVTLWPQKCGVSRSLDTALDERAIGFLAELQATQATGVLTMDPAKTICPGLSCRAWRDGNWWYRDAGHLSVDGALALAPRFGALMMDALRVR